MGGVLLLDRLATVGIPAGSRLRREGRGVGSMVCPGNGVGVMGRFAVTSTGCMVLGDGRGGAGGAGVVVTGTAVVVTGAGAALLALLAAGSG